MRIAAISWRLTFCALVLACGSDGSTEPAEVYTVAVTGTVATDPGGAYSDALVVAGVWDEDQVLLSAIDTVETDAAGAYALELEFDELPAGASPHLTLGARPALGSGYPIESTSIPLAFETVDEEVEHAFVLTRVSDPIEDAAAALDADRLLIDMYEGETVAPHTAGFLTTLRLRVDSVTDAAYGRFHVDYSATTVSPEGTFVASLTDHAAQAVLADTGNGVPGGHCGGTFELDLSPTSASADTLVAWFRRGTATGCHVDEAPFRLERVPVQADFES